MDNADAWRATIPIRSHDFPSNGSNQNVFQQLIKSLRIILHIIYILVNQLVYIRIKDYLEMQSGKLFLYVLQQELLFLTLNKE